MKLSERQRLTVEKMKWGYVLKVNWTIPRAAWLEDLADKHFDETVSVATARALITATAVVPVDPGLSIVTYKVKYESNHHETTR